MRAGVVAVLVGAVLAFAPVASAKDAGFLDLPGIGSIERLTGASAPAVSGTTSSQPVTAADRVPAPDPTSEVAEAESATMAPADAAMIRNLPGGNQLPAVGANAASHRGSDGMLLALALAVVVLFTRFLFRLNTLGPTA
jgi:hypothetical protein